MTILNVGLSVVLVIAIFSIVPIGNFGMSGIHQDMDEMREDFVMMKESIISDLLPKGDYRCWLEKPCTYCIEKTPGHGEGATCDCLKDVVTGVHPCGECIGEILEGHGNRYLSEYFAVAIAEKTGEVDAMRRIIEEKYDIAIEDQRWKR